MEYDNLENEVEDLKKQLWHLSKKVVPALESKIENSSSGSGDSGNTGSGSTEQNPQTTEKVWEPLFDLSSDDPNIKWLEAPIRSGTTTSDNLPDISLFKELRVVLQVMVSTNLVHFVNYFDISSPNTTILSFSNIYYSSMPIIFGFDMRIVDNTEKGGKTLRFNKFYKIFLNTNKYINFTDPGMTVENGIIKIEGVRR